MVRSDNGGYFAVLLLLPPVLWTLHAVGARKIMDTEYWARFVIGNMLNRATINLRLHVTISTDSVAQVLVLQAISVG